MRVVSKRRLTDVRVVVVLIGILLIGGVSLLLVSLVRGSDTLCVSDNYGYGCVAFSGYTGQSTWNYPVDGRGHNCTNYAAYRLSRNGASNPGNLGNASQWANAARSKGFAVNDSPAVGAIAQWNNLGSSTGHVAYVESFTASYVEVTDDNWGGTTTRKRYYRGQADWPNNFIHIKDVSNIKLPPRDVYAISRKDTGSNSTAVHVINITSPSQFLLHTGTALHKTDAEWSFAVADYNSDGVADIYAINRKDNGSDSTAVHVINGANPGQFLLHTGTALHKTDASWNFAVADYNNDGRPDIYAISQKDGSNTTAVHVIDGNNPARFLLNTATALQQTDSNWDFSVKDYNQDGRPDLYAVSKQDVGSNSTAVHILDGNANFSRFLLQTGTALHKTDANWVIR